MIAVKERVTLKELTLVGVLHMALDSYESVFSGCIEKVVQNLEKFGERLSIVRIGLDQPERLSKNRLDRGGSVPDQERAKGRASDDDELVDLKECRQVPVAHRITDDDASEDDNESNND